MDEDASGDTVPPASAALSTVSTAESIEDWQSDWQSTDNEELSESSEESSEDETSSESTTAIDAAVEYLVDLPLPGVCAYLVFHMIRQAPYSERTEALVHRALGDALNEVALREKGKAPESPVARIRRIWKLRAEDRRRSSSSSSHFSRTCELCYTESPAALAAFSVCGHLTCAACATQLSIADRAICPFCRKYSEIVCLVEEEEGATKSLSPICLFFKVATAKLKQTISGIAITALPEKHDGPRVFPHHPYWSCVVKEEWAAASTVAGRDYYEFHRLIGVTLKKEGLQAVDIDPIAKAAKIDRLRMESEQSLSSNRLFSRSCRVCLVSNPLHRVVYTSCGHLSCLPCADSLLPYGGNAADIVRVACPLCGVRSAYVRVFEKMTENDGNNIV